MKIDEKKSDSQRQSRKDGVCTVYRTEPFPEYEAKPNKASLRASIGARVIRER
jgi:hypothetical protein